jgi:hypothetical protein
MFITNDQYQSDHCRMRASIASRIPEEGCRIVLADGPEGEVWVDLDPVQYGNGELDLHLETNCPEWAGIPEVYEYLWSQEMTWEEWRRELAGEMARWRALRLDGEVTPLRKVVADLDAGNQQVSDWTAVEEGGLPKEVSTAEAARILGVSKDIVLKLKAAGLLEYRNTAPPDSFRPVFAFPLRSVLELRTSYERDTPLPRRPKDPPRRRVRCDRKYKHLRLTPD